MVFRPGKDCKVYISTENNTKGFDANCDISSNSIIPQLPSLSDSGIAQIGDVVGLTIDLGQEEVNISQYGKGTDVRAHTRDRGMITLTRLRDSGLFRNMNYSASWGITGSSPVIDDGTGAIRTDSGYRILYIEGTGSNDGTPDDTYTVMSHAFIQDYTTDVTPEGVTRESFTFVSADWFTPADAAAVTASRTIV